MAGQQEKKTYRVILSNGTDVHVEVPSNFKPEVEASGALVFLALNNKNPMAACPPNGWLFFELVEPPQ